jgi:hypothetical protein
VITAQLSVKSQLAIEEPEAASVVKKLREIFARKRPITLEDLAAPAPGGEEKNLRPVIVEGVELMSISAVRDRSEILPAEEEPLFHAALVDDLLLIQYEEEAQGLLLSPDNSRDDQQRGLEGRYEPPPQEGLEG